MNTPSLCSSFLMWWKSRWLGNTFILYQQSNKPPSLSLGPHVHGLLFTLLVIYGVITMYGRVLLDSEMSHWYKMNLLTLERALAVLTTFFLLLTACSDPGKKPLLFYEVVITIHLCQDMHLLPLNRLPVSYTSPTLCQICTYIDPLDKV